ncbi:hypothetical protein L0244_17935 [bacterium]|nr:hypothetical protein [bacterium]
MESMWLVSTVWLVVLATIISVANLVLAFLIFIRIRELSGPKDQGIPPPPPPPPDLASNIGKVNAKLEAVINLLVNKNTFTTEQLNEEMKRLTP